MDNKELIAIKNEISKQLLAKMVKKYGKKGGIQYRSNYGTATVRLSDGRFAIVRNGVKHGKYSAVLGKVQTRNHVFALNYLINILKTDKKIKKLDTVEFSRTRTVAIDVNALEI